MGHKTKQIIQSVQKMIYMYLPWFFIQPLWKKWHSKNLCRKLYPIPQGPFKKILLEDILILNQTMENYIYIYLSDKTVPLHWRKCMEIPGMHSVSKGNTWYRVYHKARMACAQVHTWELFTCNTRQPHINQISYIFTVR